MIYSLRNISVFFINLFCCDELFNLINCDRLINRASCTGILTSSVTYCTTYCRKWIFIFDKLQCIHISPLRCHLYVTLYRKMCRTGGLTRCCTCIITVNLCIIPIIWIPFFFAPLNCIRKLRLRIFNRTILCTKFLSELCCSCRTKFNASSACDTLI